MDSSFFIMKLVKQFTSNIFIRNFFIVVILNHLVFGLFSLLTSNPISKTFIIENTKSLPFKVNNFWIDFFIDLFSLVLIVPILEEFLFRSWVRFNSLVILRISCLALSIIIIIDGFQSLGSTIFLLDMPYNAIINVISNFSPDFNFNLLIQAFAPTLTIIAKLPLIIAIIFVLSLVYKKNNFSRSYFVKILSNLINPHFMIFINGILFFIFHRNYWENGIDIRTWIFFIPFCFTLPYVAYRFGLKASILLHIFSNFVLFYLYLSDFTIQESVLYNSFYLATSFTLLYFFIREIRLGLAKKNCN